MDSFWENNRVSILLCLAMLTLSILLFATGAYLHDEKLKMKFVIDETEMRLPLEKENYNKNKAIFASIFVTESFVTHIEESAAAKNVRLTLLAEEQLYSLDEFLVQEIRLAAEGNFMDLLNLLIDLENLAYWQGTKVLELRSLENGKCFLDARIGAYLLP